MGCDVEPASKCALYLMCQEPLGTNTMYNDTDMKESGDKSRLSLLNTDMCETNLYLLTIMITDIRSFLYILNLPLFTSSVERIHSERIRDSRMRFPIRKHYLCMERTRCKMKPFSLRVQISQIKLLNYDWKL